jgi:hypothetical protein
VQIKEQPDRETEELPPRTKPPRSRGKESQYGLEASESEPIAAKPVGETGYGSSPSSYWSVPEKRDFPLLLAHFGKDFEAISNFMKNKTPVMVGGSSPAFFCEFSQPPLHLLSGNISFPNVLSRSKTTSNEEGKLAGPISKTPFKWQKAGRCEANRRVLYQYPVSERKGETKPFYPLWPPVH